MSSIKLDLFRRDFTINTLAIQLNPNRFGILIDFFSAQKDIKEKVIRVLHNLSFVEDPTRVYRAIRFEQRFGFTMGKLTEGLIKNVVQMDFFKQLSGRRVFTELKHILVEENPLPAIKRLNDYDLLAAIHTGLAPNKKIYSLFESVKKVLSWHDLLFVDDSYMKWIVYLSALASKCDQEAVEKICEKLELAPRFCSIFCKERFEADKRLLWLKKNVPLENSVLYRKMTGFRVEILLYMMAATNHEEVKKAISHYYTKLRLVTTSVTGKDLKKLDIKPGPIYREILDAVKDAKLNGTVKSRNDELNFVKNYEL